MEGQRVNNLVSPQIKRRELHLTLAYLFLLFVLLPLATVPLFTTAYAMFSGVAAAIYCGLFRAAIGGRWTGLAVTLYALLGVSHIAWCLLLATALAGAIMLLTVADPQWFGWWVIATGLVYMLVLCVDQRSVVPICVFVPAIVLGVTLFGLLDGGLSEQLAFSGGVTPLHAAIAFVMRRRAITAIAADRLKLQSSCGQCDYDIRGIADRCPECGIAFTSFVTPDEQFKPAPREVV